MTATIGFLGAITALFLSFLLALHFFRLHPACARLPRLFAVNHVVILIFLMLSVSFGALIAGYVTSDFSIFNVYENSHRAKPLLYKITGVWGNHEGSMLLYSWMLSLVTLLYGLKSGYGARPFVLAGQGVILTGFLTYFCFTSNPFISLHPVPPEGQDLNPLLQDVGLAMHPPMLYAGYTLTSLAFSSALAALLLNHADSRWAASLRPWVLASFTFLTLGILLGSWWAYRELGWGGYWFWDPVENSSLLPWLAVTSLLHCLIVLEKRRTLPVWSVFLCLLAFTLSLIGFFLVRSGILTSVHSFASDPTRGIGMLIVLGALSGTAFTLFALRAQAIATPIPFTLMSREGSILGNNLFLITLIFIVLLGTLYPIGMEMIAGASVAVGAPYYNQVFNPLALGLLALAGAGMFLKWKRDAPGEYRRKFQIPFFLTVLVMVLAVNYHVPWRYALGYGASVWLLVQTANIFFNRLKNSSESFNGAAISFYAMCLGHAGVALLALAVTLNAQFSNDKELWMQKGEAVQLPYGHSLTYLDSEALPGPNYVMQQSTFAIARGHGTDMLKPENRIYLSNAQQTIESAIHRFRWHDIYVVTGSQDKEKGVAVRVYFRAYINLIWAAAIAIALAGVLAIIGMKKKETPCVNPGS